MYPHDLHRLNVVLNVLLSMSCGALVGAKWIGDSMSVSVNPSTTLLTCRLSSLTVGNSFSSLRVARSTYSSLCALIAS